MKSKPRRKEIHTFYNSEVLSQQLLFNPHMHKLGPRGPKHYIFGNYFNSKNARVLRFHVFLHFHATKHIISSCYSKWTNSLEVVNFIPI